MTTTETSARPYGEVGTVTYKGHTIRKWIVGYSYAANGNLHNPTPKVRWLIEDGGSFFRLRDAKAFLVEYGYVPA